MIKIRTIFILLCMFASVNATNYYVAPNGNDSKSGLSVDSAWLSIDNGDINLVLSAGDTVNILPGTYSLSETIVLSTSGTASDPIVYKSYYANHKNPSIIDLDYNGKHAVEFSGNNLILDGVYITNANQDGIRILGDSCLIKYCKIYSVADIGIRIYGNYNTLFKNVVFSVGKQGIKNEDKGDYNKIYNNTIHDNSDVGIEIHGGVLTDRIFNNIITENGKEGISAKIENICAYNNVWGNSSGNYKDCVDSAGGISVSPRFIEPSTLRFDLQSNASDIDAGLDIGYEYNGIAPDIGAFEKYNNYYVSTIGDDTKDGKSELNAWASIDNGDSLLYPGDIVHVLPGTYTSSVVITDNGFDLYDLIEYKGVRDSTIIDGTGSDSIVFINSDFVEWSAISVKNATEDNIVINGNDIEVSFCQILSAGSDGLHISGKLKAHNNTFANNSVNGIHLINGDSSRIFNNTFYNNNYGIYSTSAENEFYNNIFSDNTLRGIQAPATSITTYSIFYNNTNNISGGATLGFGCIKEDPLMINSSNDNFRLQSNSPAINSGIGVGYPYNGSAPDLGAYETNLIISLTINAPYDSLFADSIYQFYAQGLDSNGYPGDYGSLTWEQTFATGTIDSTGLFTPQLIGSGEIIVSSDVNGIIDTSSIQTVVSGTVANLTISPDSAIINSDSSLQFICTGTDSKGNATTDNGIISWGMSKGIGEIDDTGLFIPDKVGKTIISAISDLGPSDVTDTIEVRSGVISYIGVVPKINSVIEDSTLQYIAYGYDANDNIVKDITDSVIWTTDDPTGTISASGLYTAGTNPSPPDYYVFADYNSMSDSGKVTILTNGVLAYIQIEYLDGTIVDDFTTNTDNDTTKFYCRGYASDSSLLGDLSAQWIILGNDSIGTFSDSFGTFETLSLMKPGTGKIEIIFSPTIKDTSGVITCQTGLPVEIVITPDTLVISTDSTSTFSAVTYDADGNATDPNIVPNWDVLNGIGTIDLSGLFTPTTAGFGYITASGGSLIDSTKIITVIAGSLDHISIEPDSLLMSADSQYQFTAIGYDVHNNITSEGTISWSVLDPLGIIDAGGEFEAITTGVTQIVAQSSLGPIDTSSYLEIIPGTIVELVVSPDSVSITTDSTITFTAIGLDADGNSKNPGLLNWGLIGNNGFISPSGVFTPSIIGSGQIFAQTIAGISDTNKAVIVTSGLLNQIVILSDSTLINKNEQIQFSAIGYDENFNITDIGSLTWEVLNGKGTINSTGLFTSISDGYDYITAKSSIQNIKDTSDLITIEALSCEEIIHVTTTTKPNDKDKLLTSFQLSNPYLRDKYIDSITIRDNIKGYGNLSQNVTNIDSLSLYLDSDDDLLLTENDQLLDKIAYESATHTFNFSHQNIMPGYSFRYLIGADINLFARDNDSLSVLLLPQYDIYVEDLTPIVSIDTIDSKGYSVIDGMVAEQIHLTPVGLDTLTKSDSIAHLLTFDLPRNGYQSDTLKIINIINNGTADDSDIDSLVLFKDNGNLIYDDISIENKIGKLSFTGDRWTRSGLQVSIDAQTSRFYLVAFMNQYPNNNAILRLTIPQYGIEMASANDGPIDQGVSCVDTIFIVTDEKLELSNIDIPLKELIPGGSTGPLLHVAVNNTYASSITFDSLRFNFESINSDGVVQSLLDNQITNVKLYLQSNRQNLELNREDSLISEAIVTNGEVLFVTQNLTINGNGGSFVLTLEADLDLVNCKDGNSISFSLDAENDIYTSGSYDITAQFPLENNENFTINSFPANAVTINPITGKTIFGGQINNTVLDLILPSNGYANDTLYSIRIHNVGSQNDLEVIENIKLWVDDNANGFNPTDHLLGTFSNNGSYWEISGLLQEIPVGGKRVYITIDVIDANFSGGSLQYELMIDGCSYRSGMIGPDDTSIKNPEGHVVFPSDRITVISIPEPEESVTSNSEKKILTFALYNGYTDKDQILQSIVLTNITHSLSDSEYADYELGLVSIYFDSDKSTTLNEVTPLSSGRFINNKLQLSGFKNVILPTEELSYFFVVAEFPGDLIDSDSLAISIESPSDFIFEDNVNLNGVLPLKRGSYLIVDGSVVSQYKVHTLNPVTISPGDSNIPLFAFSPSLNGDLGDTLDSLIIDNTETADNTDISSLNLWIDINYDSSWQITDSLLGAFTFNNGNWEIGSLGLAIDSIAPVLFVTGDVSASATPNRSFNAKIPINGCMYSSNNDGPIDKALEGNKSFTISSSNIRVQTTQMKTTYSIGETIAVNFRATNLSTGPLSNVVGVVNNTLNPQAVTLDSSIGGPITINAGQSADFKYYFTADSVAQTMWEMLVIAQDTNDSSSVVVTPTIQIQNTPMDVPVVLINSMPTAVTKGQTNVFPLSITISHPDSSSTTAPIRIDSLKLTIEKSDGTAQLATDIFNRIVLTAGYTNLTIIENVPSLSTVPLYFQQPVIIEANHQQNFSLLVDIDSLAISDDVVLSINSFNDIPIEDNNTNLSVSISPDVIFPLKTASCRIESQSQNLALGYNPVIKPNVNFGQKDVGLIGFTLIHPGEMTSSQIQLTSLSFEVLDDLDNQLLVSQVFDNIKVRKQSLVVAEKINQLDTTELHIELNSPITLNPGESDTISILGSIKNEALINGFKIRISDSTSFVVRDLSSGSNITVTADTLSLVTANLFPIVTGTTNLKFEANSPELSFNTSLSTSVITGKDSLELANLSIVYPYSALYSSVLLKSVSVYVLDSLERPLDPIDLFDKIGYSVNQSNTINYQAFIPLSSGAAIFNFDSDGIQLNPGDSISISLVGDIEADVPYSHFRLRINEPTSFSIFDETDSTIAIGMAFSSASGQTFPIQTLITSIISPAGRPLIEAQINEVNTVYAGQTDVPIFSTKLYYDQETLQGDLLLSSIHGLISKRTHNNFTSFDGNNLFTNIKLHIDDEILAVDSIFNYDSLTLSIDSGYSISNGSIKDITILADINPNIQAGNYHIQFKDSTFIDIEDMQLASKIFPILTNGSYPVLSSELSVANANLKESFSNYPNPFFDETTITFVLNENGKVNIELFTLTGKSVLKLVENENRIAGAYNSDKWTGDNGEGLQVISGTYFCRISVTYDSGIEETVVRKISVIR